MSDTEAKRHAENGGWEHDEWCESDHVFGHTTPCWCEERALDQGLPSCGHPNPDPQHNDGDDAPTCLRCGHKGGGRFSDHEEAWRCIRCGELIDSHPQEEDE